MFKISAICMVAVSQAVDLKLRHFDGQGFMDPFNQFSAEPKVNMSQQQRIQQDAVAHQEEVAALQNKFAS